MGLSKKEIISQLEEITTPADVGSQLDYLLMEAAELNDPSLSQEIYDKSKTIAQSNYKASIALWICLARYFDKKNEALELFYSTQLDNPEEFDDVYADACGLLEVCDCPEDEIDNLRRDAEAMFNENGEFQSDWKENL